jgi:hypothetical protein
MSTLAQACLALRTEHVHAGVSLPPSTRHSLLLEAPIRMSLSMSLRGAPRRSNLWPIGLRLLRYARNDMEAAFAAVSFAGGPKSRTRRIRPGHESPLPFAAQILPSVQEDNSDDFRRARSIIFASPGRVARPNLFERVFPRAGTSPCPHGQTSLSMPPGHRRTCSSKLIRRCDHQFHGSSAFGPTALVGRGCSAVKT